jgi:hypothetical protein
VVYEVGPFLPAFGSVSFLPLEDDGVIDRRSNSAAR